MIQTNYFARYCSGQFFIQIFQIAVLDILYKFCILLIWTNYIASYHFAQFFSYNLQITVPDILQKFCALLFQATFFLEIENLSSVYSTFFPSPKNLDTYKVSFTIQHQSRYEWLVVSYQISERQTGEEKICSGADMEYVKNFTQPDFQAKNFTPQKCVNCDIFLANQQRKCIKYQ